MHAADAPSVPPSGAFVPLAAWLAGPACHPELVEGSPPAPPVVAVPPDAPPAAPVAASPASPAAAHEALRDVRLFRARLAEALELAAATLLHDLAYAVLGRELRLAPADVAAIAARIVAEHPAAEPVAVRHAPGDAPPAGVPAVADPALAPGDCVVAFAGGEVDARLGVRLAVILEAWS